MGARCFRLLGLPGDADERAIKRAYAAKLKTARPDEDPEGFQRLHDAYREALRIAASRAQDEGEDEASSAADAPSADAARPMHDAAMERIEDADAKTMAAETADADIAPPAEDSLPPFDPEAFYERLTALLLHCRDGELQRWLDAQPVLWSLADKARLAGWLLYRLHERQPPVAQAQFDRFVAYFGLDDLHSGYDIFALQRLRDRLHLVWMLRTEQLRTLAERTNAEGGALMPAIRETQRVLRQLTRPLSWPQAMFAAMLPGFPSAMRRFLYRLDRGNLRDLPPPIRPEQVAFWDAATDNSRFSAPRIATSAAGCFALSAAIGLLALLIPPSQGDTVLDVAMAPWLRASIVFGIVAATAFCAFLAMLSGQSLRHRMRTSGAQRFQHAMRMALTPALSLAGLLVTACTSNDVLGIGVAYGALAASVVQSPLRRSLAQRSGHPAIPTIGGRLLLVAGVLVPLFFEWPALRVAIAYCVPALALWAHAYAPLRRKRAAQAR